MTDKNKKEGKFSNIVFWVIILFVGSILGKFFAYFGVTALGAAVISWLVYKNYKNKYNKYINIIIAITVFLSFYGLASIGLRAILERPI